MKTKLQIAPLFLLMTILISASAYGSYGTPCYIPFKLYCSSDLSESPEDFDPEYMRKPGKYIAGTIDIVNGIQIPGLDKSQVISYETFNNGICLGIWINESDFISFLTEFEGTVEIRINLPEYYLAGYTDLPLH